MFINEVTLCGRLGRDPELKALPSGMNVCNFTMATTRKYKKDDQQVEQTEWHNVVWFGRGVEVINQYFKKGDEIYVRGRLQTRSWEKDGQKQYRTEIVGEKFEFGQKKDGARTTPDDQQHPADDPQYPPEDINPEDIPF